MARIFVVHPEKNLLQLVASHLLQRKHLSKALVIFPHRRPAAFLQYYLAQEINGPCLLPIIMSFEDWIRKTYVLTRNGAEIPLNECDQAWLVYRAARKVLKDGRQELSFDEFFPWALRLAGLFREFDLELTDARDIYYPPEESLPRKAVEILEKLGQIYDTFNGLLAKGNWTTSARMLRFLAESEFPLPDMPVYLIGFYTLTKAEDHLFRKLYNNGAFIYWYAEPDKLPEFYEKWRKEWNAEIHEIKPDEPRNREFFFFEAHDLHAELRELEERLSSEELNTRPDHCAVVLLSIGNLIPLLYFLPKGPVNLTMGYPLKLTGLFAFLKSLFALVLSRDEEKGYHLEELLEFLKSPYLENTHSLEIKLREYGAPFVTLEDILNLMGPDLNKFVKNLFDKIVLPFDKVQTPADLSRNLRKVFNFIEAHKSVDVLEIEFLAAILEKVLPVLEGSLFSDVSMGKRGLFRFFESMVSSVRVPFEGEPLQGLQIMGLLEARLLSFDKLFFLDVNEGVLPDVEEVNPLIPHGVRPALGLPDRQKDEEILRYHFERLIQSAKEVHLFWQFQTTGSGSGKAGFNEKKTRSRYVEKIIWDIEKREEKFFSESREAHRLRKSTLDLQPQGLLRPKFLHKDDRFRGIIKRKIGKISPSLLATYLECPLKFFYSKVLGLSSPQLPEEIEHTQLGIAVHGALEKFFRKTVKNRFPAIVRRKNLKFEKLFGLFKTVLEKQDFYRLLSPEKRFLMLKGAEYRLRKYLENHPEETEILGLEKDYGMSFEVDGSIFELFGRIDRIDRRGGCYVVLDYKTGYVNGIRTTKFLDLDVSPWLSKKKFDRETLEEIVERLPDLQLPFYVYLFAKNPHSANLVSEEKGEELLKKTTAAYVKLREKGEEVYLIKPEELLPGRQSAERVEKYSTWMDEKFPELLKYLVLHIMEAPEWYPAVKENICRYCEYQKICRYAV
ncbi:MAG: PD-(D/E)XK nuclease family protein [Deltaproteobacteria bacterium]|nr:PD-(D/E)XK nuclease family protein [Deltaproteobacteria bacterium]MBW2067706.1 PD-(D/E)XK nuclease family protein [Deltaproteobacteria bacterium]